ncbi:MAG: antitoxin [Euzebyaceae bacterium]|jgi:hypothetical protein|nr:antitoxin [Euzebyaceae bacterium]
MRTTVTFDPDTAALLRAAMHERGVTFKQVVNDAVRAGLGAHAQAAPYHLRATDLGPPSMPLTKALQLAADLEDEELVRRLETGR